MASNSKTIVKIDDGLAPYRRELDARIAGASEARERIVGGDISEFANGYMYFGINRAPDGWVYREWAPGASQLRLFGDFNGFNRLSHPLKPIGNGVWELRLPPDTPLDGSRVLVEVERGGVKADRIPAWIRSVVRQPDSSQFIGRVSSCAPFPWRHEALRPKGRRALYIYEAHVGMATEGERIGSYAEFAADVLPRVKRAGYNAIQLMAIQEHPYYASFGYQVTGFFAPSSWYGSPDDLKSLIDSAHSLGLSVLLDLVHSHMSRDSREGLADFDLSGRQYCAGDHPAWGTKLFDYGKPEVVHFLLSNIKYWLDEFHFDGFRFDGVTSMLYNDHALGRAFTSYSDYFGANVNQDAWNYLCLATGLIHAVNPAAVAVAEEVSGMPALCLPAKIGGAGFDYRLNMGVPDMWIKLVKDTPDEAWDPFYLWHELTTRRPREKTIGYAESHDQALVGDKTLIFRLLDAQMYTGMEKSSRSITLERGLALINLIKLLTLSLACDGWLSFMGNEFGHPEWIDFPREGNGWSFKFARRQWSLADNPALKYDWLARFDRELLAFAKSLRLLSRGQIRGLWIAGEDKLIAFERAGALFAVNLHPSRSQAAFHIPAPEGSYRVAFDTDAPEYGGQGRISREVEYSSDGGGFAIYLPARSALALIPVK